MGFHVKTALVTVVSGDAYVKYANELFDSAREFFRPTEQVDCLTLEGREGWPSATMFRHHVVLENWVHLRSADFVFLIDADMLIRQPVGPEILSPVDGVTATLHPGYVGKHFSELPYESRTESGSYVNAAEGDAYFCGGLVGGERAGYKWLASQIRERIDFDVNRGVTPVWHDESALNRVLSVTPPEVVLPPAYCHPTNDSWYRTFWPENYPTIIEALDKPEHERHGR